MQVNLKIEKQIQDLLQNTVILDRRFLDDEQLDRGEQFRVLDEIFALDVRDAEIRDLSSHFAPMFRGGHPVHLSLYGKTGTGKTVTMLYYLNMLQALCRKKKIDMRYIHLDLSTPKPCFRVLNDLACYLDASKRYKKGISLDELMGKIEEKIESRRGYFIIFVDEIDHVRRDLDSLLKFLVKRLPQTVALKLVLVFSSNRLNWQENIDPRIKGLSVNSGNFPPADDGSSEMNEGFVAFDKFFIPDKQFPESVEPGMCCLNNPPTVLWRTSSSTLLPDDSRCIAAGANLLTNRFSIVSLIRIQEPLSFVREGDDHGIKHGTELTDVMSVRSGNDQRQRDAMGVHQEMALAPLFSPDPWDSGQSPLVQGVP